MTIDEALRFGVDTLKSSSDTAQLDSECLLTHSLSVQRSHLYAWPQQALTAQQVGGYQELLASRARGVPVAYLRGWQEFWSLRFHVGPGVLIPRPETELLVEQALARELQSHSSILDLGTGSGCIALSLAAERPMWQITAVDESNEALSYAKNNRDQLAISNIELLQSSWFAQLTGQRFDLIVSNPPYVGVNDVHLGQGDVRFEPLSALASGPQGLDDIRAIAKQAKHYLVPGGMLMLEHGFDQATAVAELLAENQYKGIQHFSDLQQHIRVTMGYCPG